MIYFDAAATTFQKPRTVKDTVRAAMDSMSSPGRGNYPTAALAAKTLFQCRMELGELFGVEERAEALAAYAEETFAAVADIPEADRLTVYYGNKEDSLETAPAGSSSAQVLEMANAVNAAGPELGGEGRVRISLEQLLAWDPDVIVVNGEPKANLGGSQAARDILSNPDLASLKAVQTGRVYGAPNAPFSWIDRPPGPNRIAGVRWLFARLYPDACQYDVDEEIRTFFWLFYHVELLDDQLRMLYEGQH